LRNIDAPLTIDVVIVGRPAQLYSDAIRILENVAEGRIAARAVLAEAIRILIIIREEKDARMKSLLAGIQHGKDALPLSSEAIIKLLEQHLSCRNSSRLPVLIVAAAYSAASNKIGESPLPLKAHNAADEQTGAMGDVEICLVNDNHVVTVYEMKDKRVTKEDIDRALQKIVSKEEKIDNYIFITTDTIDNDAREYASTLYEITNGTEIAILDCIGFVRHFLHLFHRIRIEFLDSYQTLLLSEPDSAVKQPLKEALLSLRHAAESDE
ncbi:MAG: restriction endonuclease, SacI family, partial [bacterium]